MTTKDRQARERTEYVTENLVANLNPILWYDTVSSDLSFCDSIARDIEVVSQRFSMRALYDNLIFDRLYPERSWLVLEANLNF